MNIHNLSNSDKESDEESDSLTKLANSIREQLKKYKTYTFRPVRIDGIYCYAVIHTKIKIVNFESIHVSCPVEIKNSSQKSQKYSLLYKPYKTIEGAIRIIEKVVSTYRIYNGDLVNPIDFEMLKLEEKFIPYEDSQKCSVCLENTQEMTTCNHYICFHCREKCICMKNLDCPICRNKDVLKIFNIDNHLLNNAEYAIVRNAVNFEYNSNNYESNVSSSTESSEQDESSSSESSEQDESSETIQQDTSILYQFPIFHTPNIFASPSMESFEDIINPIFPFMSVSNTNQS